MIDTERVVEQASAAAPATKADPEHPRVGRSALALAGGLLLVVLLCGVSLFVGVADLSIADFFDAERSASAWSLLLDSRVPRTVALVLAGSSLAVAGLIMQLLTRNHFVEPSTAGTLEFAGLGLVIMMIFAPGMPLIVRMLVAAGFALVGTAMFLKIILSIPLRDVLVVPLVGIMLGGIVAAASTFIAYRADLLQSLNAWMTGEFSAVLSGRYEMLWLAGLVTVAAIFAADRFTVAGMGEEFTTNLGLHYRRTLTVGLIIVSIVSAVIVVTVGMLPFLGLVVPNLVRLIIGDNARRSIPWVALAGAAFILVCDLLARILVFPFELPIGTVMGVLGAVIFLVLVLRREKRA